jgi:hypothetical protein
LWIVSAANTPFPSEQRRSSIFFIIKGVSHMPGKNRVGII